MNTATKTTVYHGGLGKIHSFDHSYGGANTCDNEHGAFYFSESIEIAEDYSRQAFIRRYQDNIEDLVEDGFIDSIKGIDPVDEYEFTEDLAEHNLNICKACVSFDNPLVIDAGYEGLRDLEKRFNVQDAIGFLMGNPVNEIPEEIYDFDEELPDGIIIKNVIDDISDRSCFYQTIHIALHNHQIEIL